MTCTCRPHAVCPDHLAILAASRRPVEKSGWAARELRRVAALVKKPISTLLPS